MTPASRSFDKLSIKVINTMVASDTKIAGHKTVADWQKLKATLIVGGDATPWIDAFEAIFHERLKTRYFDPIDALDTLKDKNGEGFSIVTIHCSLIEFLSSTLEGKSYRYRRRGDPPLSNSEYSTSRDMFVCFLRNHVPFCNMFSDDAAATDFYVSVRCGLFHEARTKGSWRIKLNAKVTQAIDTKAKIVYRNKMQEAFDQFIQWYREQLPQSPKLQSAFIAKFDSLCVD